MAAYYVDGLNTGLRWGINNGSVTNISYTFANNTGNITNTSASGYQLFNTAQQTAGIAAMQQWENIANIHFVNQATNVASRTHFDITFRQATMPSGVAAWAYYPNKSVGSDITLSKNYSLADTNPYYSLNPGYYGFLVLVHELGHALGLEHSFDTSDGDRIPVAEDSFAATVMSYTQSTLAPAAGPFAPRGPQIYDIAAIQAIYGANHSFNSGNDTYQFSGQGQTKTIWDGSGIDTFKSTYTGNSTIDLREGLGNYSTLGADHVWIAFGANIENVASGTGSDTVYGNQLANTLDGNNGADRIYGGDGNDILIGNLGNDTLQGDNGNDTYLMTGNSGADTISDSLGNNTLNMSGVVVTGNATALGGNNFTTTIGGKVFTLVHSGANLIVNDTSGNSVTILNFTDGMFGIHLGSVAPGPAAPPPPPPPSPSGILVNGTNGADLLNGASAADTINGLDGDDQVYGKYGNDILNGGNGNDYLNGNEDQDTINGDAGNDIIYGERGHDSLNGGIGADLIYGGMDNDTIHGGDGNDTIRPDQGDDTVYGELGNDIFIFKNPANNGNDLVMDFQNPGAAVGDMIWFTDLVYSSVSVAMAHMAVSGGNSVFTLPDGYKVTVVGAALTSADIQIISQSAAGMVAYAPAHHDLEFHGADATLDYLFL